ncbi:MAG: lipopolysaccharide export system permease protein [Gammaproteobacteria bacterium]|jgi:lipopolysaccharide export system permease protein
MILERYIYREILEKLLWIMGLLLLILASNRFVGFLSDAAEGDLPGELVLQMLSMKMLSTLPNLLPISLFISVTLAMSRLAQDRELTIISGTGLGAGFQFKTVFKFALIYSLVVFICSFVISPWAEKGVGGLKGRAEQESDISGIGAGQFKEFSKGDRIVYVEKMSADAEAMENVFLQVRQHQDLGVLRSRTARYEFSEHTGSRYIAFEKGHRYLGKPGMLDYQITRYRTYAVLIEQSEEAKAIVRLEAVPSLRLIGSKNPQYKAELQWRMSYIFATLLLPLLAVALTGLSFRETRYVPLFIAIMVYFIYSNLLGISKTLIKRDDLSAMIGMWWVHLLLILTIVAIFKYPRISYWRHRKIRQQRIPGRK